jgi:hypothetical protein
VALARGDPNAPGATGAGGGLESERPNRSLAVSLGEGEDAPVKDLETHTPRPRTG